MSNLVADLKVQGKYFWTTERVVDNPTDSPSGLTVRTRKKTSISTAEFIKRTTNIKRIFTYGGSTNVSIKFKGGSEAGGSANFSVHREVARSFEKSVTTKIDTEEETIIEQSFTLQPGYKGAVYRLDYITEGALVQTNILSLTKSDDVDIETEFSVFENIPGLRQLAQRLLATHPKRDNRGEWRAIRGAVVEVFDESEYQLFETIVQTMSKIKPKRDNRGEWSKIRGTCEEILNDLAPGNYHRQFTKFLSQLGSTVPLHDNKGEWRRIRETCEEILTNTTEVS